MNDPNLPFFMPRAERLAAGKNSRRTVPRSSHGPWTPAVDRRDPIDILADSHIGRAAELVPSLFARMLESPFTFFRGAASIMTADLATTPVTGIRVVACGD